MACDATSAWQRPPPGTRARSSIPPCRNGGFVCSDSGNRSASLRTDCPGGSRGSNTGRASRKGGAAWRHESQILVVQSRKARVAAGGSCARWAHFARIRPATHAWVAKLVDARDLRRLSTRLGNGRREWGQIRWNSSTSGWLQYRAKPWFGACSGSWRKRVAVRTKEAQVFQPVVSVVTIYVVELERNG